jgi:small GTP-binding protein
VQHSVPFVEHCACVITYLSNPFLPGTTTLNKEAHVFSCQSIYTAVHRVMSKPAFLKVVLLGDGGVGKSSLIQRFVSNKFDPSLFHTIGVEFLNKDLEVEGERYTLQIWDTAGQERFKSLRTPFYRGSDCCLLTYAIDDPQSFQNVAMWKKEFLYYADVKDPDNFPFVVLGNKSDLVDERKVNAEEAGLWCEQSGGLPHFETSAKDAVNVDRAFVAAIQRVAALNHASNNMKRNDYPVDLSKGSSGKSGCCS